jgi:mannose-6-phosphate isomerase-like protein (cupin superfamily)
LSEHDWEVFTVEELSAKVEGKEASVFEFLRTPTLSCMVYRLPAGSRDMQAPHLEDEVYFVLSGRARLRVAGLEREVAPGNILFIRATLEHSFFKIEEDLTVVAVFGAYTGR